MADQVDSMSDAELRTKLAEHGFPIMPITASTRKLLVKKLKLVLDNKSKPRNSADHKAENRRTLARYSSGEESDLDNSNVKEKRGRRQTTGGAMLPPAVAKTRRTPSKKGSPAKLDDKGSESEEEKSPMRTHEEVETVTTRRVTRTYANDQDDYETGSDSDVDADKKTSSPLRSNSRSSDHISSTFPTADASTSPPKSTLFSFSRPSISSPSGYSSTYTSGMSSSDHLNSIRSRLGLTSTIGDRPSLDRPSLGDPPGLGERSLLGNRSSVGHTSSYTSNNYQPSTSTIDEVESPYLSNFTRRLTTLKTDTQKPTSFLDRDVNNGGTLAPRRSYISGVTRTDVDYKTATEKKFLKNNLVSLALVAVVALFFFCLFLMYIVKKNDITSVADDQNSDIPICQLNIPGNRPGINCVPKDHIGFAKDLLKVIHPELTARTAAHRCGAAGARPYLTEREVLDLARARAGAADPGQCRADLLNLQVLLLRNPRWGLRVVQLDNPYTRDEGFTPLTDLEHIVQHRAKGALALALADPATPLSCLFLDTVYSAGATVAAVAALGLLALGARRLLWLYAARRKRRSDELFALVEQIIDVIQQETEEGGAPYVSVDHVRDSLLPPGRRERRAGAWDAAVRFLQQNESRVRMEVQSVGGEDCRVWRWVGGGSPRRAGAAWQGQAFETQEGSVNNPPASPTPCLKIRHMFEKGSVEASGRALQDAILEKCEGCDVLHVAVDPASCCVYVKCASAAHAGLAYRALHGWWYEGRLITVKFLRLERYMQRFPDSPSGPPYLRPARRRAADH